MYKRTFFLLLMVIGLGGGVVPGTLLYLEGSSAKLIIELVVYLLTGLAGLIGYLDTLSAPGITKGPADETSPKKIFIEECWAIEGRRIAVVARGWVFTSDAPNRHMKNIHPIGEGGNLYFNHPLGFAPIVAKEGQIMKHFYTQVSPEQE